MDALEKELQAMYEVTQTLFPVMPDTEAAAYQAILILSDNVPVACGTFRRIHYSQLEGNTALFGDDASGQDSRKCAEVNRIFVAATHRGRAKGNIAPKLISALEEWGAEQGFEFFVLKTANRQVGAIHLYERAGWKHIALYGEPYPKGITIAMGKHLK